MTRHSPEPHRTSHHPTPSPAQLRVSAFTPALMNRTIHRVLDLDAPAVAEGTLKIWGTHQFLSDLSDKWRLSFAVLDLADDIVAYRIGSGQGKLPGYAHTHRTMVDPSRRRSGLATVLLTSTVEAAKACGYRGLTGKVVTTNATSRSFLQSTGWVLTAPPTGTHELWRLDFD